MDMAQDGVSELAERVRHLQNKLQEEEEHEKQIIQEQNEAEQELADALSKLKQQENRDVLHALDMFRNIDFDGPHGQVHQQVQSSIDQLVNIGSAKQLMNAIGRANDIMHEIEDALKKVRDSYQKTAQDVQDEKDETPELREIEQIIGQLQQGINAYRHWATGEGSAPSGQYSE